MRVLPARSALLLVPTAVIAAIAVVASRPHDRPTVAKTAAIHTHHAAFRGARIPAGKTAPDFRLTTETGQRVRLSAQHGKLVLLAFLYTHCPDICPIIATRLDSVVRGLGPRAGAVRIFAISVDPVGDTPAVARTYVKTHRLGPEFHWLLGTREELWPVWRSYNVAVSPETDSETIAHTAPVLLLDRSGRPRVYYQELHAKAVAHDVRLLLR
jgi:protein SCO1/2